MTSKLSWIAFAPLTILALAIKVIQMFFITETNPAFLGFDSMTLSYFAIGCAVVVLLFAILFCVIDRKIAPVYIIRKNYVAGIVGIFFAAALACDGANCAFEAFNSANYDVFNMIDIAFTVLSAVVMVVMSLNHFVGNGGVKGLSLFYLIPALWSVFRLVRCFMAFTTVSITVTDVTGLVAYIFLTLFLFNYATIIALMKGKSPVKTSFIYGMPAVIMLLCYGFTALCTAIISQVPFDLFDNLEGLEHTLAGIYILSFVIEMTIHVKTKDKIQIIDDNEYDDLDDSEQSVSVVAPIDEEFRNLTEDNDTSANKMLFSLDKDGDFTVDSDDISDIVNEIDDTEGYIYSTKESDEEEQSVEKSVEQEINANADKYITKANSKYTMDDIQPANSDDDWIDHIDQLILEISEDEFKQ